MEFVRKKQYDNLIMEIKQNEDILEKLNYDELKLFIDYLIDLKKYLKDKKGE